MGFVQILSETFVRIADSDSPRVVVLQIRASSFSRSAFSESIWSSSIGCRSSKVGFKRHILTWSETDDSWRRCRRCRQWSVENLAGYEGYERVTQQWGVRLSPSDANDPEVPIRFAAGSFWSGSVCFRSKICFEGGNLSVQRKIVRPWIVNSISWSFVIVLMVEMVLISYFKDFKPEESEVRLTLVNRGVLNWHCRGTEGPCTIAVRQSWLIQGLYLVTDSSRWGSRILF